MRPDAAKVSKATAGPRAEKEGEAAGLRAELDQALARAEAAERSRAAFLTAMTHELKTPLNAILGFTGILLEASSGPLSDVQRRQLSSIDSNAHRLAGLVDDVLDFTRLKSGRLRPRAEEFDLALALELSICATRPEAEKKGIHIELVVEAGAERAIGNIKGAERVLRHLLSNAVKFSDRGSIVMTARRSGASVEISVKDEGIGMGAEDLVRAFEPLTQINEGRARQYEGLGLGLALSRLLAESMGGRLCAESEPGKGSVFTFSLPPPVGR